MGQLFSGSVAWQEEMMPAWVPARTNEESRHNTRLAKDQKGNDKVEQGTKVANSSFTTGEIKGDHNTVAMVHEETKIQVHNHPVICASDEPRFPSAMLEKKIRNVQRDFVETEFFKQLQADVIKRGVVTLTGIAGEGKTTMGLMMCQKLEQEGYTPVFYENVDAVQTDDIARSKKKLFVVIDNFLGKSTVDPTLKEKNVQVLFDIIELRREGEQVGQSDQEQKSPLLLLLLSRDDVYEQAVMETLDLKEASYRQHVSSRTSFTKSEKKKFLDKYAERAVRKPTSDEIDEISKMTCSFGFPKMCQLYAALEAVEVDPVHFFRSPKAAVRSAVYKMMNRDSSIKAALAFLLVEEALQIKYLQDTECKRYKELEEKLRGLNMALALPAQSMISPVHLVTSLESMCGGLLEKENGIVVFSDSSVKDAVSLALAKNHIAFVARHCSLRFITEHIRLSHDTCSDPCVVIPQRENFDFFVERLVKEVMEKNLQEAFMYVMNQDSQVLTCFWNSLLKLENFNDVLHSTDKNTGTCFLFWMSFIPFPNFKVLLKGKHFDGDKIWQAICGCCITGQASEIEFLHQQLEDLVNWQKPLSGSVPGNFSSMLSIGHLLHAFTPGDLAAAHGHTNVLAQLFQLGMPVNTVNSLGQTPLTQACMAGYEETVEFLLEKHKADAEIPDQSGCKPLHWAIQLRHTKIARTLIEKAKEKNEKEKCLNMPNARGQTLLMLACGNMPEVALQLLRLGAKPDEKDRQGRSCLHYASLSSDSELVEELIQHRGVNVNSVDMNGISPLHQACYKPANHKVVKVLLDFGADPHRKAAGATPLHVASACDVNTVKVLLEKVENIDVPDSSRRTPLMYACFYGKDEIVKSLLSKNANAMLTDDSDNTTLHLASNAGFPSVVDLLVEKFSPLLNAENSASQTPFFFACAGMNKEIVQAFIKRGTPVAKQDKRGRNALHAGASVGSVEIVKLLLEVELDINSRDQEDITPMMYACFHGRYLVVCHLVEKGARTEYSDKNGNTALHFAAANGEASALLYSSADKQGGSSLGGVERYNVLPKIFIQENGNIRRELGVTEYLLDANCIEVDVRNNERNTPLLITCLSGNAQTLEFLIVRGADLYARDRAGNTALHHGSSAGHLPIIKYLVEKKKFPTDETNDDGETPLEVAIRKNMFSAWKYLSQYSPGLRNKDGNSALHIAAKAGNIPVAEAILDTGSTPVDDTNKKGETPLHLASQAGMADMARYLIKRNASTKAEEGTCRHLPLHLAAWRGHLSTVQVLMDKNPQAIDAECKTNWTPLHCACISNSEEIVKYIINKDKSAVRRDRGDTCLHFAARRGHLKTVKTLLDKKLMEVDLLNDEEETPLHCACAEGQSNVVSYLIKEEASQRKCWSGNMPLHLAAKNGDLSIVKALVEEGGASVRDRNGQGHTPLQLAREAGKADVVEYLSGKELP